MAKRTQKAGATARFGARYGVSVRRRAGSALSKKSRKYTCPSCHYAKVRRKAAGIWECRKCSHTFSGGVWEPYTRASDANKRIVRRSLEGQQLSEHQHPDPQGWSGPSRFIFLLWWNTAAGRWGTE